MNSPKKTGREIARQVPRSGHIPASGSESQIRLDATLTSTYAGLDAAYLHLGGLYADATLKLARIDNTLRALATPPVTPPTTKPPTPAPVSKLASAVPAKRLVYRLPSPIRLPGHPRQNYITIVPSPPPRRPASPARQRVSLAAP
ncbi:MAG: hypothetical protein LBI02_03580 [Opitutaceae bacterium]|nr:hypothetical protein [Opitutaceae bacterium]